MSDPVLAEVLTGLRNVQNAMLDLTVEVRAANSGTREQIAQLRRDVDDHETRLRLLEGTRSEGITREELDARDEKVREQQDRAANRRIAVLGAVLVLLQILEAAWFAAKG